jgi:dTMP kinase
VQLFEEVIAPALARGETIVSDRYHLSTLVYQGIAGGVGESRAAALLEIVLGSRRPDLNVVIDLPLEECQARRSAGRSDRMESKPGFLPRVAAAFRWAPGLPGDRVVLVDGAGDVESVAQRIRMSVNQVWPGAL